MANLHNYTKMEHFDDWDIISIVLGSIGGVVTYLLQIDVPVLHTGLFSVLFIAFMSGAAGVTGKLLVQAAVKYGKTLLTKYRNRKK